MLASQKKKIQKLWRLNPKGRVTTWGVPATRRVCYTSKQSGAVSVWGWPESPQQTVNLLEEHTVLKYLSPALYCKARGDGRSLMLSVSYWLSSDDFIMQLTDKLFSLTPSLQEKKLILTFSLSFFFYTEFCYLVNCNLFGLIITVNIAKLWSPIIIISTNKRRKNKLNYLHRKPFSDWTIFLPSPWISLY